MTLAYRLFTFFSILLASVVTTRPLYGAELANDFDAPSETSRPWVYVWGNNKGATPEDYTRQIEQLKDKGFGAFILYGWAPAKFADNPVFQHLLKEAERNQMFFGANNTVAWPAGGPHISWQNLPWATVSSVLDIEGGKPFRGKLPEPPLPDDLVSSFKRVFAGKFPGNAAAADWVQSNAVVTVAVQAFPLTAAPASEPKVTASSNEQAIRAMFDGSWNTTWVPTPPPQPDLPWPKGYNWIQFDFGVPRDVDSLWVDSEASVALESSDDGQHFSPFYSQPKDDVGISFPVKRARFFRVVLNGPFMKPEQWAIRDLALGTRAEVERRIQLASKRGLNLFNRHYVSCQQGELSLALKPLSALPDDLPLSSTAGIDLTDKVGVDGTLNWDPPPGRWRIVWLRRSIANGSEVSLGLPDYLNPAATREDFEKSMDKLGQASGDKVGKTFRYYYEDNNEIHSLYNWTPAMLDEFQRRRGYDARPYLAAMAGEIVDSAEITDRFLTDVRRTIADCVAEHHYALWTQLSRAHGMQTRAEAGGAYLPRTLCHDGMANLSRVDVMVGEFWDVAFKDYWQSDVAYPTPRSAPLKQLEAGQNMDVKEVASASHLYGKPLVDMEAFTSFSHWDKAPGDLLMSANVAFCEGVNHMTFHGSDTTLASEGAPGSVYVGTHFNDKNTWWSHVGPFVSYIQRCSAMLQHGLFVGDVLYYIGDECPALVLSKHIRDGLCFGYDYDECNTEALLTRLSVKDGKLVTPEGQSYRVLVLPERPFLTLPVAKRIKELISAGATVIGPKPLRTPGLAGYPECDQELRKIATELWDSGKVINGQTEKAVLAGMGVPVDFAFAGGKPDALLDFIHRREGETEIYFVINRRNHSERVDCSFRVAGKQPELWNAFDDTRRNAPAYTMTNGVTTLPLELPAYGSTFVVFRTPTDQTAAHGKPFEDLKPVQEITGPWNVHFDPKWGGPKESMTFEKLVDWTNRPEEGIKYYSGTATYRTVFKLQSPVSTSRTFLDLGTVNQLATVRLNGKHLGLVWHAPWRVDATAALKPGENTLEVDVVNTWFNRLVLDVSLPAEKRVVDLGNNKHYWAIPKGKGGLPSTSPLRPAGLLGPVQLMSAE